MAAAAVGIDSKVDRRIDRKGRRTWTIARGEGAGGVFGINQGLMQ